MTEIEISIENARLIAGILMEKAAPNRIYTIKELSDLVSKNVHGLTEKELMYTTDFAIGHELRKMGMNVCRTEKDGVIYFGIIKQEEGHA